MFSYECSEKRKFFELRLEADLTKNEEQSFVLSSWRTSLRTNFSVAIRPGETPVPIPNTMVKTWEADGTALETVWESRWLPNLQKKRTGFTSDQR